MVILETKGKQLVAYLPVQGRYHAHRLTVAGNGEDAFTQSLTSARVEMNPHQVDAALFALKSPLSKSPTENYVERLQQLVIDRGLRRPRGSHGLDRNRSARA